MLSLTNMIPAEGKLIRLPLKPSLFAGLLIFLTATALICLLFLVYLCIVSRSQKNISHVEHVFIPEWMNLLKTKHFIVLLSQTLFLKKRWNKDKQKDLRTRSVIREEETQRNLWYGELECFWSILAVVSVKLFCPVCSRENMRTYVTLIDKGLIAFSCQVCINFLFVNSVLTGKLKWWWIWSRWQLFKIKLNKKSVGIVGGGNMAVALVCSADTKSPK